MRHFEDEYYVEGDYYVMGQIAPIFLSHETGGQLDLFSYSQNFYAYHKDNDQPERLALPRDFGVVSSLRQMDEQGERTLPPNETIAFDARDQQRFVWDISYADAGAGEVLRLWVGGWQSRGLVARVNHQGGLIETIELSPDQVYAAQSRLAERLESPEVQAVMAEMYQRRTLIKFSRAKLVNQRTADISRYAQDNRLDLKQVPAALAYDSQIAAQDRLLETTGFAPMMLFNPKWLDQ